LTVVKSADQHLLKILNSLIGFIFLFFLSACSTTETKTPIKESSFEPQGFSSTLFYEENGKSYKLKADIYLLGMKAVRIDLRTQLDLPLASLLMTDQKLEYVLYRDKKYFNGKPGPHALDSIVPLDISAEDLVSVILEKPLKNQKCFQVAGQLTRCQSATGPASYSVYWEKRDSTRPWLGKATKFVINLPSRKINLKFYLTDWQKKLSNSEKLSTLQVPDDFQK
jgi:hypothetical protein